MVSISNRRVTRHCLASNFTGRKPGLGRPADGPNGTIPPRPVHGDPEATPTVRRYGPGGLLADDPGWGPGKGTHRTPNGSHP